MRPAYLVLTATRPALEPPRCCDDVPPNLKAARVSALRRWARKFRLALPPSLAVFRRAVRTPLDEQIAVGDRVVTRSGRRIGKVRDVVVGREGAAAAAVAATPDPGRGDVLIPLHSVRRLRGLTVAVIEEDAVPELLRSA